MNQSVPAQEEFIPVPEVTTLIEEVPHDFVGIDIDALSEREWRREVLRRFEYGRVRMDDMDALLAKSTAMQQANADVLGRVHDIVEMGQSAFRALAAIARVASGVWVWLGPIVRALGVLAGTYAAAKAAWVAFRGGTPPHPPTH